MAQSLPPRRRRRSPVLALGLALLVLAILGLRRRAMGRNEAQFRARYDQITGP